MKYAGYLTTLKHEPSNPVNYFANLGEEAIPLNELLGSSIELTFLDEIVCVYCGRKLKKSSRNNACYVCSTTLPENDICIVKPELCHFHQGTCRDESFGEKQCMQPHIVYLALSNDVKVGITRKSNMLKRWIDQGAVRAIPFLEVPSRKTAGDIEVHLAQFIKDKTNWRKMLKNEIEDVDLFQVRSELIGKVPPEFQNYIVTDPKFYEFEYPHISTLEKINSLSLDKQSTITGKLIGIKGQYLIFDSGVFNMRKHAGYKVEFQI